MGAATPIVLALMQASGTYAEGRNQEASYRAQAEALEAEARNKDIERANINTAAAVETRQAAARQKLTAGSARAAAGAGGFTQESGTLWDNGRAADEQYKENLNILQYNLYNQDWGLRKAQADALSAAGSARRAGKRASQMGILSTATSLAPFAAKKGLFGRGAMDYFKK